LATVDEKAHFSTRAPVCGEKAGVEKSTFGA
jgi:hypothetical protein